MLSKTANLTESAQTTIPAYKYIYIYIKMVTLNAGLSVVSSVNFKIFQPIVKEIPSYVKDTHDFIKKFYQKVKDIP